MYVLIGLMGAINGLLAGVVGYVIDATFLNLHAAVWAFLIAWATTTSYLSYKRVPSGVVAVGLYFVGLFVLLQPVAIYGPLLAAAADTSGITRAQLLIDGWRGVLSWGVTAGALAVAIALVSQLLKRHAKRVVSRRRTRNLWHGRDD